MASAIEGGDKLRAATRTIYDAVYPSEEWTPVTFEEAERLQTVHYRNALTAARSTFGLIDHSLGALL